MGRGWDHPPDRAASSGDVRPWFRASQKSLLLIRCHPERVLHETRSTLLGQRRVSACDGDASADLSMTLTATFEKPWLWFLGS